MARNMLSVQFSVQLLFFIELFYHVAMYCVEH